MIKSVAKGYIEYCGFIIISGIPSFVDFKGKGKP